ncbi:MAG: hypothetical protein KDD53_04935, partial [Bdellovibrionales bacterium]|nr:hypothetical protein [Bdellovibrionales bacterium]
MLFQIPDYTDTVCQRRYVRRAPQAECAGGLLLERHRVDSLAEELRQLATEHGLIQIRYYEHRGELPYFAGGKLRCEGFYGESECKPRTEPLMLDDGGIVTPDGK